jgi:hypothetical protein
MITHRPAKYSDVFAILEDLSDVSRAEMMNFDRSNWDALYCAKACMRGGGLDCLVENGTPLAVIGTVSNAEDCYKHATWFMASKKFFDLGVKSVIGGQRYMRQLAKSRPGVSFESLTASKHPQVERWFALLGFRRVMVYSQGYELYVYEGVQKDAA